MKYKILVMTVALIMFTGCGKPPEDSAPHPRALYAVSDIVTIKTLAGTHVQVLDASWHKQKGWRYCVRNWNVVDSMYGHGQSAVWIYEFEILPVKE